MPTIGVDFKIRQLEVDSKAIKLQIWDTAGHERFKTITAAYYKGAHGIIIAYDITQRDSFTSVQNWMHEIEKHAGDNISRILVGNKCDLDSQRAVSTEEGREMDDHYNIRFLETSARDSKNVEQAFIMMAREIKNRVSVHNTKVIGRPTQPQAQKLNNNTVTIDKKAGTCC